MDADVRKKLQRAKRLFLASMGSATNTDLARQVGLVRQTISKHRRKENWDAELHAVKLKTTEKIVERASEDISSEILKFLKGVQTLCNEKLLAKDKDGNYLRDESGNLLPNKDLRPGELLQLAKAAGYHLKNYRLVAGQSTSNELIANVGGHSHRPEHDTGMVGSLGSLIDRINSSPDGFPEAQAKLYELARVFQEACALADDLD